MTFSNFQTITHGKWILAGEHAVIRGHAALVFPIKEKQLHLHYHCSSSKLSAEFSGESGADMHLLFWSVLEQGMHLLGSSLNRLSGHFHLESNIPVGVGMGASAALCVAMARWFAHQNLLQNISVAEFARELEHLFHGKSSGLDITGVSTTSGSHFQQGNASPIQQTWQPLWYLSTCGQIGITSHCINQVTTLWELDAKKAEDIDLQMSVSVSKAREALAHSGSHSLQLLADAMNSACECFENWGLVSDSLKLHIAHLKNLGALAVKPTGSGGGGNVVSLWENAPQTTLSMIKL